MPAKPEPCPLCGRELLADKSVNEHHPVPKSRGGKGTVRIHVVCHSKIHSVFTEKELGDRYHDFAELRAHPEMAKFIGWVRKKPPGFRTRHRPHSEKGRR